MPQPAVLRNTRGLNCNPCTRRELWVQTAAQSWQKVSSLMSHLSSVKTWACWDSKLTLCRMNPTMKSFFFWQVFSLCISKVGLPQHPSSFCGGISWRCDLSCPDFLCFWTRPQMRSLRPGLSCFDSRHVSVFASFLVFLFGIGTSIRRTFWLDHLWSRISKAFYLSCLVWACVTCFPWFWSLGSYSSR